MNARNYDWTNVDVTRWNKHHMSGYIYDQHRDLPSTRILSLDDLVKFCDGDCESAAWNKRFAAVYADYKARVEAHTYKLSLIDEFKNEKTEDLVKWFERNPNAVGRKVDFLAMRLCGSV